MSAAVAYTVAVIVQLPFAAREPFVMPTLELPAVPPEMVAAEPEVQAGGATRVKFFMFVFG